MCRRSIDLVIASIVTVLAAASVYADVGSRLPRVGLGVALALLTPGYCLSVALFPRHEISRTERLALTLGLSLALGVVGGLTLDALPSGLTATAWAALLAGVSLLAALIGAWRRGRAYMPARVHLRGLLSLRQALLFGVALSVAGGAVGVARAAAIHQVTPGFTQLWMLPADGTSFGTFDVGVRNLEKRSMAYILQVEADGIVMQQTPIDVAAGETQERTITLHQPSAVIVTVLLFRQDDPAVVYRKVSITRRTGSN